MGRPWEDETSQDEVAIPEKGEDDEVARRKGLTFEQAEGLHPLPTQPKRTEISAELRAILWEYVHNHIHSTTTFSSGNRKLSETWERLLRSVHVYRDHRAIDLCSSRFLVAIKAVRNVFEKGDYSEIYGWVQFVLQNRPPAGFAGKIESILRRCRSPYRVVDDVICPLGSDKDAETVQQALSDAAGSGLNGSREHLRAAAEQLGSGSRRPLYDRRLLGIRVLPD